MSSDINKIMGDMAALDSDEVGQVLLAESKGLHLTNIQTMRFMTVGVKSIGRHLICLLWYMKQIPVFITNIGICTYNDSLSLKQHTTSAKSCMGKDNFSEEYFVIVIS